MYPRPPNDLTREPYKCESTHAALTADKVVRLDKIPAGRSVRITSVQYINPTGLAGDTTNTFVLKVRKNHGGAGAADVASVFNTDTDSVPVGASLAADTWVTGTVITASGANVLKPGDTLDLFYDESGTTTLPADGRIVIRGEIL